MKLVTLIVLILGSILFQSRASSPDSAYANAYLTLTSSNQSELATANATSSAGNAVATAQPGLLGNSILTSVPSGEALSFQNESVSGFSDMLTINGPGMTGSSGSLLFHFLVNGLELFGTTTAPALSSIITSATFAATGAGTTGASDYLTFTQDAAGNTTGTDFLGVSETVSVPFTFGIPFKISLEIDVTAAADNIPGGGSALVSGSFSTTASTDTVMALVHGAPASVPGFSAHTASGANYFSVAPIPEPNGFLLGIAGLAALPFLGKRRWA